MRTKVSVPEFPGSPDELVRMADRAMYRAKQQGKDRVVLHSQPAIPAV